MALDLEPDRAFQEKWWIFERFCWLVMLAVIVAAILGLTGRGGPMASAQVEVGESSVIYPRVARWQTAANMSVDFPAGPTSSGEILLPTDFISVFSVEGVTPQPESVTANPSGTLFKFRLEPGSAKRSVQFALRPVKPKLWTTIRTNHAAAPPEMSFVVLP